MSSLLFTIIGTVGVSVIVAFYVIAVLRMSKREQITRELIKQAIKNEQTTEQDDKKELSF